MSTRPWPLPVFVATLAAVTSPLPGLPSAGQWC